MREEAAAASTTKLAVQLDIVLNTDAQDEAARQHICILVVLGAKEGTAVGITTIFGKEITNAILRTTNRSNYKHNGCYSLHLL